MDESTAEQWADRRRRDPRHRLSLHVLAATVWVGGQFATGQLPSLREARRRRPGPWPGLQPHRLAGVRRPGGRRSQPSAARVGDFDTEWQVTTVREDLVVARRACRRRPRRVRDPGRGSRHRGTAGVALAAVVLGSCCTADPPSRRRPPGAAGRSARPAPGLVVERWTSAGSCARQVAHHPALTRPGRRPARAGGSSGSRRPARSCAA